MRGAWIVALGDGAASGIGTMLGESGYEPIRIGADSIPLELERRGQPDVVVVNAGPDGLDDADAVLTELRHDERLESVPLLLVVAPEALADAGPSTLAEELLRAPVSAAELRLRIARALHRLERRGGGDRLAVGALELDFATHEARIAGRTFALTHMEFELLRFLASHPRRVFSRELLLDRVWGYDFAGSTRTVDVHVRRVRAKLGSHAGLIQTVRSVGYRFEV